MAMPNLFTINNNIDSIHKNNMILLIFILLNHCLHECYGKG